MDKTPSGLRGSGCAFLVQQRSRGRDGAAVWIRGARDFDAAFDWFGPNPGFPFPDLMSAPASYGHPWCEFMCQECQERPTGTFQSPAGMSYFGGLHPNTGHPF
jgi:hypothetical protein